MKRLLAIAAVAGLAGSAAAHDVVLVGVNASNQLVGVNRQHHPVRMDPSIFPGLSGWLSIDFGFEQIAFPEPGDELQSPSDSAMIAFRLLSADTGLGIIRDGGGSDHIAINEIYTLGQGYFHVHPTFQTDLADYVNPVSLTVQLTDLTGTYADSAPIHIEFITVPAPAAAGLLGLGGLMAARRRR